MKHFYLIFICFLIFSCDQNDVEPAEILNDSAKKVTGEESDSSFSQLNEPLDTVPILIPTTNINTKNTTRAELVRYAKTLMGVPYKYASTDPVQGFDCSGFITYVFNHFDIAVPRSSVDFTNVGKPIDRQFAQAGDLILFTGTDSMVFVVGHMGIITDNSDSLRFIHSTSGKANGVTITTLNKYYEGRFVKVIEIFTP